MNKHYWLGVDLGKQSFEVAVAPLQAQPQKWASLLHEEFANTQVGVATLLTWLDSKDILAEDIVGICAEATGRLAWQWSEQLQEHLGCVSIVNPARPRHYASSLGIRTKTDRVDACVLALYGVGVRPKARPLPTAQAHQLRELSQLLRVNRKAHTANNNRVQEPLVSAVVRRLLKKRIKALDAEKVLLEQEIDRIINADEQLREDAKRIQQIPGIGPVNARIILAKFGDLRQYKRNELTALAGLYPKEHTSGTSVFRKAKLAKGGGAHVRSKLYMASLTTRRKCPQICRMADRMARQGKCEMYILGAVMHKLLLLARSLVVSGEDYCPNHGMGV